MLILILAFLFMGLLGACAPLDSQTEMLGPMEAVRPSGARAEQEAPELRDLAKFGLLKDEEALPEPPMSETFYDFPITRNDQVDYYLDFFTNRHRKTFARWLARSGRYLPMIKQKFAEAGLPQDLAYLPMIESGFRPDALSRASAVGTWQFMRGTGLNYGLTINEYVDERRDPEKSTAAAAAYLSALYDRFDSWHLAVAAYNAGEGTISKAMKRQEATDFWEIAQGRYIQDETKLYVPQLIAAIMIAKDPEKYGFGRIDYESEPEYETVHVPSGTPLKAVALACAVGVNDIQGLNQQLCKSITPPSGRHYPLKVPVGKKDLVSLNLPKVREVVTTEYKEHVAGKKESVASVAGKYGVGKAALLKANGLRKERLAPGQRLRIPMKSSRFVLLDEDELARYPAASSSDSRRSVKEKAAPRRLTVASLSKAKRGKGDDGPSKKGSADSGPKENASKGGKGTKKHAEASVVKGKPGGVASRDDRRESGARRTTVEQPGKGEKKQDKPAVSRKPRGGKSER